MTNPDPGKETRLVDVRGRNVVVRELKDAQLMLMSREARLAGSENIDTARRMACVSRLFDILESALVQETDREYIMDITVKGELEFKDLLGFITAFEPDAPKPRARRGRPPTKRA